MLLFFHRHPAGQRMFPGQPWYHPIAQLHHGFLKKAVGDFCYSICIGEVAWLFTFCWTCRFILWSCPCKFWKVCLGLSIFHRSIMEGNWPAWMLSTHRLSLICLLNGLAVSALSGSQQQWYGCPFEKSWWSYRARWCCRYTVDICRYKNLESLGKCFVQFVLMLLPNAIKGNTLKCAR